MLIGERWGLLKLLFSWPGEQLLGVHVIGDNAGELPRGRVSALSPADTLGVPFGSLRQARRRSRARKVTPSA